MTARRGTAYFGRKLNELPDAVLDDPSLLDGWSRAHDIAHVGYNARSITRLMQWANRGVENPMYPSPEARNEVITYGATLTPIALRNLQGHSAIHLNVEWRDTPSDAWACEVKTAQGRTVSASETIWMRTREVWIHATELDNGATFEEVPEDVPQRLLQDIITAWRNRGQGGDLVLRIDGTGLEIGDLQ